MHRAAAAPIARKALRLSLLCVIGLLTVVASALTPAATASQEVAPQAMTPVAYLPAVVVSAYSLTLVPIGTPIWQPVDIHLFSAPGGSFEEFQDTIASLLPPPNHGPGGSPGAPHAPPYDIELAQGVSRLGYHEGGPFRVSEFSQGNAIYIVWTVVPAPGVTGSSLDFSSGPIIPKDRFPIHFSGICLRNGETYDPQLTDMYAVADLLESVDGASHDPVFVATNTSFGPPGIDPVGNYEYRLVMTDSQGNGWSLVAEFVIQSD